MVEHRGYFPGAKAEEMAARYTRGLARHVLRLARVATRPIEERVSSVVRLVQRRGASWTGLLASDAAAATAAERASTTADGDSTAASASAAVSSSSSSEAYTSLQTVELRMRSLIEETTLRASTYRHVVLVYVSPPVPSL